MIPTLLSDCNLLYPECGGNTILHCGDLLWCRGAAAYVAGPVHGGDDHDDGHRYHGPRYHLQYQRHTRPQTGVLV